MKFSAAVLAVLPLCAVAQEAVNNVPNLAKELEHASNTNSFEQFAAMVQRLEVGMDIKQVKEDWVNGQEEEEDEEWEEEDDQEEEEVEWEAGWNETADVVEERVLQYGKCG